MGTELKNLNTPTPLPTFPNKSSGTRTQKLKHANALANFPEQVLWDILDTGYAYHDSDHPFDDLKFVLLWQIWQEQVAILF